MKYTQKEILEIQCAISTINIPFLIDSTDLSKVKLTYKFDKNIFVEFTHLINYVCMAKSPNGQYISISHRDFPSLIYHFKNWLILVKKEHPVNFNRISHIETFSPRFYKIFEEAKIISDLGFEESAGMIFRKATEILIKDFLLNFLPSYSEVILSETVGGIVFFFYDVTEDKLKPRISRTYKKRKVEFSKHSDVIYEIMPLIEFVNKTFKIGNDFSHYERKLEHFTAIDLEKNITQILAYLAEKYQIMEAQKRLKFLDSEFQSFSID